MRSLSFTTPAASDPRAFNDRGAYGLWSVLALLLGSILGGGCAAPAADRSPRVCFDQQCFAVEVVSQREDVERGLKFRAALGREQGMFFVFPQNGVYRFWMQDTLIPLDIIWLDETKKVIFVAEAVPPCQEEPCATYGPEQSSRYVLEINAGAARASGIMAGKQAVCKDF